MPETPKAAAPKPSKAQTDTEFLSTLAIAVMHECGVPLEDESEQYALQEALFILRGRSPRDTGARRAFVTVACLRKPNVDRKTIADMLEAEGRTPGTIFNKAKKLLAQDAAFRATVTALCTQFEIAMSD